MADRVEILEKRLDRGLNLMLLYGDYLAFKEGLDAGLKRQFIYRYPNDKLAQLHGWQTRWEPALSSFPSSEADVEASIDCWALGHPTASVFHAMRVLEHGLRALAAELGKTFGVQNWQNIINEMRLR